MAAAIGWLADCLPGCLAGWHGWTWLSRLGWLSWLAGPAGLAGLPGLAGLAGLARRLGWLGWLAGPAVKLQVIWKLYWPDQQIFLFRDYGQVPAAKVP